MAIDSVSSYSSGSVARRPPDPAPDATAVARQQDEVSQQAQADQGASPQYVSAPQGVSAAPQNDPEASIQQAQTVIQSANAGGAPSEAETRRAAEAYQAASAAQSQIAQQQQQQGAQSLNVLA
jgi:hypothetical protein